MKKLTLVSLVLFLLFGLNVHAQRTCGTMDHLAIQMQQDPTLKSRMDQIEREIQQYIQANPGLLQRRNVITIPVVVHVVHNGEPVGTGRNISDAQVLSQIQVLNEDFRRTNADASNTLSQFQGVAADVGIEFCLATVDPNGNPTNGIDRVYSSQATWSSTSSIDANLKPQTIWDRNKYLNIWTVDFGNNGLLGYAQFPGGSASTDGVVIGYQYFGRYPDNPFNSGFNRGRTTTHEVGHWLNLRHIWGDGGCSVDDGVSDTPLSDNPNYGCPLSHVSCGSLDMVQNYMDYSDDDCMNLFTQGQASRMIAALNTARSSILTSNGCQSVNLVSVSGQVKDAATAQGVAQAKVLLSGVGNYETTANNNGSFTFNNVAEGTYDVYAGKWGYRTNKIASVYIDASTGPIVIQINQGYYDDFLFDFGWSATGSATTGQWERGEPIGTSYQNNQSNPEYDVSNDFGDQCYVTGNGGGSVGNDDIDNGNVVLTSPVFDLSNYTDPWINYTRWFYNGGGSTTPDDQMTVSLSNGSTTVVVEMVTHNDPQMSQWVPRTIRVQDYLAPTGNMRIIIESADQGSGHLVEAAFDLFEVFDSVVAVNPVADFTASSTAGCSVLAVQFTDNSTGNPTSWSWSFPGGNPSASTQQNPTVTYSTPGIYDVTLSVSNANGSDSHTKTGYITVYANPAITITRQNASCPSCSDGSAVASASGGQSPYGYLWNTGATTASISGLAAGTYTVTATDANGCSASQSVLINAESNNCTPVTNVWSSRVGLTSVRLNWTAVPGAQYYQIAGRRIGGSWVFILVNGNQTFKDVYGLSPNESYEWKVRTICDASGPVMSTFSPIDTFTTGCNVPGGLQTLNITTNSATFDWNPVQGAVKYEVQGHVLNSPHFVSYIVQGSQKTVTGLNPGTTYEWRVRAICSEDGSLASPYTQLVRFTTLSERLARMNTTLVDAYPNPAGDELFIKISGAKNGKARIAVFNLLGDELIHKVSPVYEGTSLIQLDITSLETGFYLVRVETDDQARLLKILVE